MKNQLLPNEERIEESSLIDSADQITQVQKKCMECQVYPKIDS